MDGSTYKREWYRANRERILALRRATYAATRDERLARDKQRRRHNPAYDRNLKLKKKYGITLEDFERMLSAQGGKCAVCDREESSNPRGRLCVDHDHATGKIRKLLCHNCNRALGLVGERAEVLERMKAYLEEHSNG